MNFNDSKKGYFNKQQLLASALIEDIMKGGNKKAFKKSAYGSLDWSYRDMWWITRNEHGAFEAMGVHGQTIYIDSEAKNSKIDPNSLPADHAVTKYLIKK